MWAVGKGGKAFHQLPSNRHWIEQNPIYIFPLLGLYNGWKSRQRVSTEKKKDGAGGKSGVLKTFFSHLNINNGSPTFGGDDPIPLDFMFYNRFPPFFISTFSLPFSPTLALKCFVHHVHLFFMGGVFLGWREDEVEGGEERRVVAGKSPITETSPSLFDRRKELFTCKNEKKEAENGRWGELIPVFPNFSSN